MTDAEKSGYRGLNVSRTMDEQTRRLNKRRRTQRSCHMSLFFTTMQFLFSVIRVLNTNNDHLIYFDGIHNRPHLTSSLSGFWRSEMRKVN